MTGAIARALRLSFAALMVVMLPLPAWAQAQIAAATPAKTSCAVENAPPTELGSYNRANLRAMVEEQEDLCSGRPLSPAQADAVLLKNTQALSTLDSQKPMEGATGAPKP